MKRILTIPLMIFARSAFALSQMAEEQAVMKAERDLYDALVKGDAKTVDRILADDMTEVTVWGYVSNKQSTMNYLKPRNDIAFNISEMKVRIYGNAAVVTGLMNVRYKVEGKGQQTDYVQFTDTFVKNKNGWQMVATQQNTIPVWQARKLEDSELKALTPLGCDQESTLKSLNADVRSFHRVTNLTNQPIKVVWINYEGKRNSGSTVEAGKTGSFNTYLTHPFLIIDASGKCLGIYQPMREPGFVVVK